MFKFDPERNYEKTTKSRSVIRFQDCDPLRHLNNAKYFDYYFNGREDQVPKLYDMQNSEIYRAFDAIWVVYNHQISYLRSAGMGEWVKLFSRVIWFNENSLLVEYFMTDDEETQLKNILWSKMKFVDAAGKATEHPEKLIEFLNAVSFDDYKHKPLDFDERLQEVKAEVKNKQIRYT